MSEMVTGIGKSLEGGDMAIVHMAREDYDALFREIANLKEDYRTLYSHLDKYKSTFYSRMHTMVVINSADEKVPMPDAKSLTTLVDERDLFEKLCKEHIKTNEHLRNNQKAFISHIESLKQLLKSAHEIISCHKVDIKDLQPYYEMREKWLDSYRKIMGE